MVYPRVCKRTMSGSREIGSSMSAPTILAELTSDEDKRLADWIAKGKEQIFMIMQLDKRTQNGSSKQRSVVQTLQQSVTA